MIEDYSEIWQSKEFEADTRQAIKTVDIFIMGLGPKAIPTYEQVMSLHELFAKGANPFSTPEQKTDLALDRITEARVREYFGYRPFWEEPELEFRPEDEEARQAYMAKCAEIRGQIERTIHTGKFINNAKKLGGVPSQEDYIGENDGNSDY